MNVPEIITYTFIVLVNFVFGVAVYVSNPRKQSNQYFALLTIVFISWIIGLFAVFTVSNEQLALIIGRSIFAVTIFISCLFTYFIYVFPEKTFKFPKVFTLTFWGFTITWCLISLFSPYIVKHEMFVNSMHVTTFGSLYPIYIASFIIEFLLGFIFAIIKLKSFQGLYRVQLYYLLTGGVLALFLGLITNVILPFFFNMRSAAEYGPLATIIFMGFVAYSMIRHQLLDIRLVIARSVAYTLLILIIAIGYVGAAILLGSVLLNKTTSNDQVFLYTVLTLIVAFSFDKLREFIERTTDKVLFKGQYNTDLLLGMLSKVLSTSIELHPLALNVLRTLLSEMRITRGAFIVVDTAAVSDIIPLGFSDDWQFQVHDIHEFLSKKDTIVFDELEENSLKQSMRSLNITIFKVLQVKDERIGLLLLGEKASGDAYSSSDLKVLDILGPEISVAIQNAKAYDEINRFNITLKEEVHKATNDLENANRKLKELDRLKDDFVSVASHELRTPMTAIRSYAWMALHKSDIELSDKMKKYLERTLISTERLINLVNDMLNISRIESGRVEITPKEFDIQELVDDVIDEVSAKAKEKNLQIQSLKSTIPKVFADPDKIHQILLNLIGNSLKFTPEEGIITIAYFSDGADVQVSVHDTGVGIAADDIHALFQKFGRLDSSYSAVATTDGTGLGLYICKSLITLMKGKIWAASEGIGKGSTFTFTLPVASEEVVKHASHYQTKVQGEAKGLEPVII